MRRKCQDLQYCPRRAGRAGASSPRTGLGTARLILRANMIESLEQRLLMSANLTDQDIGSPPIAGSASYDTPSDTYTVTGSGSDIGGTADQFNFDNTSMAGNGTVAAYVNSMGNTSLSAKAGVMIRNDATASSSFAAVLVTPGSGIIFEWRTSAGAASSQQAIGLVTLPLGMEIKRAGNSFTAFYTTNGTSWVQIGIAETITISSTALAGVAVTSNNTGAACTAAFSSVGVGSALAPGAGIYSSSNQTFLDTLEKNEVMYFYDETNSTTGLVPDFSNANGGGASADSSIAAIGFGLTALVVGSSRGWIGGSQAYNRALTTINFLYNHGANVNGFFYHFLNETTGGRYGTSEVSSVDNAELEAGVLTAAQYWAGTPLQTVALQMFDRVNWPWMQQSSGIFYGAWTPESGFSGGYGDYSEASLLYLLSLGSPTYPTTQASWNAWSRTPVVNYSGYNFITADDAALFTIQWPQAWFNLQGYTDSHGLSYYTNSQTATLAQRQFMINLSSTYPDYGANMWGLTPSEGGAPTYAAGVNNYTVWGGPPAHGPIDGTVVPTGPGGSLEFEPELGVQALQYMATTYPAEYQKYGLVDAFNPYKSWSSTLVLGIDIGMMIVSAENSRSNLVWNIFMQSPIAQQAMAKAFPGSTPVWQVAGSGNWNSTVSWTTARIPNSAGAEADFFGAIATPHTVYSDTAITAGILHFNNSSKYLIAGAGSLTLQATGSNSALVQVDQGTDEINLPLTLASNTTFNVAAGSTLIIADPLTINAGVTLTTTGGGTVTYLSTTTLLSGSAIVADYASGNDPTASFSSQIAAAKIISPDVSANPSVAAIGAFDNGSQLVVRASWIGDANLDGVVNADDLSLIMLGQAMHKSGWSAGDFNNDNQINADDWAEFAYAAAYSAGQNFNESIAIPDLAAAQNIQQVLS